MKPLSQYPVSFPFGATSDPYSPSNPHKGDDHAAPYGTPIDVNGVVIGLVGSTGLSTGNHCHIGRFVGGRATNPNGGGFRFNDAVVTEIGQDATNGKYVRVQADDASWVYLHMSDNSKVKVGDKLQGADMPSTVDRELSGELLTAFFTPEQIKDQGGEAFIQSWAGTESNSMIKALYESPQFRNKRLDAEQTAAELRDAQARIKDLESSPPDGQKPIILKPNTVYQTP